MSDFAQKRILVIDDDAMNREVMEAFLSVENYEVILANNGAKGMERAEQEIPDLLIVDVRMPDITGYELCEQIKANLQTKNIPIIIVTGLDAKEDRERAKKVGADAFLSRPFEADELLALVKNLLS